MDRSQVADSWVQCLNDWTINVPERPSRLRLACSLHHYEDELANDTNTKPSKFSLHFVIPFWSDWRSIIPQFIETYPSATSQYDSLFTSLHVLECKCAPDDNKMATRLFCLSTSLWSVLWFYILQEHNMALWNMNDRVMASTMPHCLGVGSDWGESFSVWKSRWGGSRNWKRKKPIIKWLFSALVCRSLPSAYWWISTYLMWIRISQIKSSRLSRYMHIDNPISWWNAVHLTYDSNNLVS